MGRDDRASPHKAVASGCGNFNRAYRVSIQKAGALGGAEESRDMFFLKKGLRRAGLPE